MRPLLRIALALLLTVAPAAKAIGQPVQNQADTLSAPGRVEIGAGGTIITAFREGSILGPGASVTVNFTRKHGLQLATDGRYEGRKYSWTVGAVYTLMYRYTFAERADHRYFIRAGAAGAAFVERRHAHTISYPAYTIVRNGVPVEYAARTYDYPDGIDFGMTPPAVFVGGLGGEVRVAKRLIFHGQVDAGLGFYLPIAVKVSVAAAVPLGRVK